MISADVPVFPNNVVDLIATRAQLLDSDLTVVKRPLRASDPTQAVGVFPSEWRANTDTTEIGSIEPTIQRYTFAIQAFVKDMDEERGLATHSVLSKMVRSMLYRDPPLHGSLGVLSVEMSSSTERTQRWGIGTVRYVSNEIQGSWLYLSTLEFWLETETL